MLSDTYNSQNTLSGTGKILLETLRGSKVEATWVLAELIKV